MCNLRRKLIILPSFFFLMGAYISCGMPKLRNPASVTSSGSIKANTSSAELVVQLSHANPIISMALSKNGKLLVTVGENETVRLWDVKLGNEIRQFKGHKGIRAAALSEDGHFLLTGSKDKTACLWDTASGKKILSLEGHAEELTTVAIAPGASYLLTGCKDGTFRQWNASDGRLMRNERLPSEISSIAVSSDGRHALIGCFTVVELWDLRQGKRTRSFKGHNGGIYTVAISPNGRFALTGSQDGTARLWDTSNGKEIHCYKGHQKAVVGVTFSRDGEKIATGSKDGTIRIWDVKSEKEKQVLSVELEKDGAMHIWDANAEKNGTDLSEVIVPVISKVIFLPDDKSIIFAAGRVAGEWSVMKSSLIQTFAGNSDLVSSVIFSPNDNFILIGSHDNTAYLWNATSGMPVRRLQGHNADVRGVAFSPDGRLALTGGRDCALLWNLNMGTVAHRFTGHKGGVRPVAFSPMDGRFILTGGDDGTARLWDREKEFTEVRNFGPHEGKVSCAVFSPDGHKVLTTSENTIQLWDWKSGAKEKQKFEGHIKRKPIYAAAFSPNGDLLVTGSMDNTARVWDVKTGTQISKMDHPKGVMTAVFSQDSHQILTGCEDGIARLRDINSGKVLREFVGHESGIWQVALSQNQRFMISASRDQTIRFWEVETGKELCKLINFRDGSWAVVDRKGRFDASNGGDVQGLHWVVGNETIALHQLKERYYEPGLLAKLLKFNKEPLSDVSSFTEVALYPAIKLRQPTVENPTLGIKLMNRGGGIGKVIVSIHGKELLSDARPRGLDPEAESLDISVNLANHPNLISGMDNMIEVRAFNAEGYLSSRGVKVIYCPPGEVPIQIPTLWAIVVGVSEYKGERLNLHYAAKDAQDIEKALKLGATRLFGPERVKSTLLSSPTKSGELPTKARIKAAFEQSCAARPWDILVVYLAGHGVSLGDSYFYLTQEARSTDLTDPKIRDKFAISSEEMGSWLQKSPARKQVMVLDTCAAGTAARKLVEQRNLSSDQIRAIERLKDRTGFHVLMGSAADAVSYEATQYEQGLLTYALLRGMRGEALREGKRVDVSQLFQFAADLVPTLASNIGGIQRPRIAAPKGTSFEIGLLTKEDISQINPSGSKPMLLAPYLINSEEYFDNLGLAEKVRLHLKEQADASMRGATDQLPAIYVPADQLTGAVRPTGQYSVKDNNVQVILVLSKDNTKLTELQLQGTRTKIEDLARNIVKAIYQALDQLKQATFSPDFLDKKRAQDF